jgi:ABC-type glycerol-3-phosphate transport system substrate-binding protein
MLAAACSSGSAGGSAAPDGVVKLVMWMGFTPPANQSQEYLSLKSQVAEFTRLHPKIHI